MFGTLGNRLPAQPLRWRRTRRSERVRTELKQILDVVRRGTPHSSRLGLQRLLLLMLKSAPMTLPTGMRLNSLFAF